jgi:AcrR family transcriptional regulator
MTKRAAAVPALVEAFREYEFEGASIARLCAATGLGKGSLYNFFPGGKEEMAASVLADVDAWFTGSIFEPLRNAAPGDPAAISAMFEAVTVYFGSGRRVCLREPSCSAGSVTCSLKRSPANLSGGSPRSPQPYEPPAAANRRLVEPPSR